MWRSKKFIIVVLLAVVLLVGGTVGVVFAQTENENDTQPKTTLLARVAEILGIEQQKLEDAFAQARSQMRDEALDSRLANLVAEGKITNEEADQYKAWLQARPDMEPFQQQLKEWGQARPDIPPELKEWQEARPDIPLPGPFGPLGGHGGFPGMGGMRGFGGLFAPAE